MYRSVLQSAFLPPAVSELEQAISEHVDALIDDTCERGECDFVTDFAVPLPLTVIGDMLGTPPADLPVLFELTARMEQAARSGGPFAGAQIVEDLGKYFNSLIGVGGTDGQDTLLARLRSAELDGRPLNDVEIAMFFAILIFAGNDTTRNTLSSGIEALLARRPESCGVGDADRFLLGQFAHLDAHQVRARPQEGPRDRRAGDADPSRTTATARMHRGGQPRW